MGLKTYGTFCLYRALEQSASLSHDSGWYIPNTIYSWELQAWNGGERGRSMAIRRIALWGHISCTKQTFYLGMNIGFQQDHWHVDNRSMENLVVLEIRKLSNSILISDHGRRWRLWTSGQWSWTGGVPQVVEHLLCNCEVLSSTPSPKKKKKKRAVRLILVRILGHMYHIWLFII